MNALPKGFKQAGLTLVELLVTVLVIVMVSMIAAPSFSGFADREGLSSAARDIYSQIAGPQTG